MGRLALVFVISQDEETVEVSNYSAPSEWGDFNWCRSIAAALMFPIIPPQVNGATAHAPDDEPSYFAWVLSSFQLFRPK